MCLCVSHLLINWMINLSTRTSGVLFIAVQFPFIAVQFPFIAVQFLFIAVQFLFISILLYDELLLWRGNIAQQEEC